MATSSTTKKKASTSGLPLLNYKKVGGDLTFDTISAPNISVDPLQLTDTNIQYDKLSADQISADQVSAGSVTADKLADRFMTAANYTMTDPAKIAQQFGDITRNQMSQNQDLSSELALKTLDTELQGLYNYAPAAAALKRTETAQDNLFNQAQRDAQLAASDPNLRADLMAQRERATAYAEGRVPNSIQDRALELGIRSRAADTAAAGGFGVRSSAARKASELMSAEQRIQLSQYGDQALTQNIANRSQLLLSPTMYSDAGNQISVNPTISAGQAAMALAQQANDKGIISSSEALQNTTQQQQFQTQLQQETNRFNTELAANRDLNQAQMNLQAGQFNVDASLRAQMSNQQANLSAAQANQQANLQAGQFNIGNQIQTQQFGMQLNSQERQFNTQMAFNVANTNAGRQFEASNINAGRALEVATQNRNMQFQIQQFNQNLKFQDMQQQRQLAASAANARMSYNAQMASISANKQMQQEQMAMQYSLAQQNMAQYKEGMERGQRAQDQYTNGNIVGRLPQYGTMINSTIQGISNLYDMYQGSRTNTTNNNLNGSGVTYYQNNYSSSSSSGSQYQTPSREPIGQNSDGSYIYA